MKKILAYDAGNKRYTVQIGKDAYAISKIGAHIYYEYLLELKEGESLKKLFGKKVLGKKIEFEELPGEIQKQIDNLQSKLDYIENKLNYLLEREGI